MSNIELAERLIAIMSQYDIGLIMKVQLFNNALGNQCKHIKETFKLLSDESSCCVGLGQNIKQPQKIKILLELFEQYPLFKIDAELLTQLYTLK